MEIWRRGIDLLNIGLGCGILGFGLRALPTLRLRRQRACAGMLIAAATVYVGLEVLGLRDGRLLPPAVAGTLREGLDVALILCLALAVRLLVRSQRREIAPLHRLVDTDRLTGLHNLEAFRRAARSMVLHARRYGLPLALLMLDVDEFKDYNDTYGHEAGNEALKAVAGALRRSVRGGELVARYGGEEFVALVFTDGDAAWRAAERLREAVEAACAPRRNMSLHRPLTVSVGGTELTASSSRQADKAVEDLIRSADGEMYRAKRAGRNRVSIAAG